jgi:hypothetical protein
MFVNLFVAATNLVVIVLVRSLKSPADQSVMIIAAIASILMHLSETKHHLPGIFPFNKFSWFFLQLDRCTAYFSAIYFLRLLISLEGIIVSFHQMVALAVMGLISLFVSERIDQGPYVFMISHGIWHVCAFMLMLKVSQATQKHPVTP